MNNLWTRRGFLQASLTAAGALALPTPCAPAAALGNAFSFILLGDLHFDRLAHHDLGWLQKNKSGDLGQIKNYSRITAEITPHLFATLRAAIADLNAHAQTPVAFVLQVGDMVEGLCGTEQLATQQNQEALA